MDERGDKERGEESETLSFLLSTQVIHLSTKPDSHISLFVLVHLGNFAYTNGETYMITNYIDYRLQRSDRISLTVKYTDPLL